MKRSWLRTTALCLALVAGVVLAVRLPRTVPAADCSEAYRTYADRDGFKASFIKDYRVNDSVYVDVTLIEATTDEAWDTIKKDFNLIDLNLIEIPEEFKELFEQNNSIDLQISPRGRYDEMTKWSDTQMIDCVAISRHNRKVCIYHVENKKQVRVISGYELRNNKNPQK